MSSIKINSTRRNIAPQQRILRKQKSFIETGFITQGSSSIIRADRPKIMTLKKQLSIDEISTKNFRSKYVSSTHFHGNTDSAKQLSNSKSGIATQSSGRAVNANKNVLKPSSEKSTVTSSSRCDKKEKISHDRSRKSFKETDDRINLNIFLAQITHQTDEESVESDLDSSTDNNENVKHQNKKLKYSPTSIATVSISSPPPSQTVLTSTNTIPSSSLIKSTNASLENLLSDLKTPAATRRRNFQTSREIYTSINRQNTGQIPGITATKIERPHPPLVRAMSAPVRSFDENHKNILANKRKPRRRKLFATKVNVNCEKSDDGSSVIETSKTLVNKNQNQSDCDEILNDKYSGKTNKKTLGKGKGALGCDIETLVSLISLDNSDSEKEDTTNNNNNNNSPPPVIITTRRPPLLRKSGKSVSFQEDDINNTSIGQRGFSHIRRGSVAPLAARIRANRPPTAPPGSVFIRNMENINNSKEQVQQTKLESDTKDNGFNGSKLEGNDLNNNGSDSSSGQGKSHDVQKNEKEVNEPVPDEVRTTKERECWRLWQKMARKGVAVSFDTILRGMLTPTELRIRQKQREAEEARKAKEDAEKAAADAEAEKAAEEANKTKARTKATNN